MIRSISADERGYGIDQPLRFPAGTSNVQIGFSAESLSNPEAIRFRYRLQEIGRGWHEAGTTPSVSSHNLAPGPYHFAVAATDTNGIWSDNMAVAPFIVLPAFYQTAWFRAVAGALFRALLWAAYLLRIRRVQHAFNSALEARQRLERALDQAEAAVTEGRNAVQGLRASATTVNDLANGIAAISAELTGDPAAGPVPLIDIEVDGASRDLNPASARKRSASRARRCATPSNTPRRGASS
jgi:Y_Y_Y domain